MAHYIREEYVFYFHMGYPILYVRNLFFIFTSPTTVVVAREESVLYFLLLVHVVQSALHSFFRSAAACLPPRIIMRILLPRREVGEYGEPLIQHLLGRNSCRTNSRQYNSSVADGETTLLAFWHAADV